MPNKNKVQYDPYPRWCDQCNCKRRAVISERGIWEYWNFECGHQKRYAVRMRAEYNGGRR